MDQNDILKVLIGLICSNNVNFEMSQNKIFWSFFLPSITSVLDEPNLAKIDKSVF